MNRKVYSKINDIEEIWNNIYTNNIEMSWYQSYEWNKILEKAFFSRKIRYFGWALRYIVYDNKLVVPLLINKKEKRIELLGTRESSDYLSFIYDISVSDEELFRWINCLLDEFKMYSFELERINENSRLYHILSAYISQSSIRCKTEARDCVVVDTRTETDVFLASLSKSTRQNYRTAINRIKKDGLKYRVEISNEPVTERTKQELLELYKERRADCSNKTGIVPGITLYLKRMLKYVLRETEVDVLSEYSVSTSVFLSKIYINDDLAAFCEGSVNNRGGCISVARVATKSDYYKYSPGHIMLVDTIQEIKNDISYFDLTRGTEDYKFKLGGSVHHNYCFYFQRQK